MKNKKKFLFLLFLVSGCKSRFSQENIGNENSGASVQATQLSSEFSTCKEFSENSDFYIRVMRHRSVKETHSPFFFWKDLNFKNPTAYLLERLNIFLVQGKPSDKKSCVVDFLLGYSGGVDVSAVKAFSNPIVVGGETFQSGYAQTPNLFKTWRKSIAGSGEPLPEGLYSLENLHWFGSEKKLVPAKLWPSGFPVGNFFARPSNPKIRGLGPFSISLIPQVSKVDADSGSKPMQIGSRAGLEFHTDVNEGNAPGTAGCLAVQPEDADRLLCWMRYMRPKTLIADWNLGTVSGTKPVTLEMGAVEQSVSLETPCSSLEKYSPEQKWHESNSTLRYQRLVTPVQLQN
jgi:hypothetical protein